MKTGYFPGCSLTGTSKEFDKSLREVAKALGGEINEINDWNCCGASSAHISSHLLSVALPARNLILAKEQGFDSVFAPCAACYNRLLSSKHELNSNNKMKEKVESILETKYQNGLDIINIIQYFQQIGKEKISEMKKVDLGGINVACYYGCLLLRPTSLIDFDDSEEPTSMEELVKVTGANPVDWNFKTECCGAAHSIAHTDIVEKLSKKIIDDAISHKADAIVVACPMCHSNLDMRQKSIEKTIKNHTEIPILYLSELIGLSLGIEYKKLGLNLHFINPVPTIEKLMKKEVAA
ncbi:MAG: CoB--CoM heterodisulfide reductase iron-sulfur subunit B family protein [FCB group bacterium]